MVLLGLDIKIYDLLLVLTACYFGDTRAARGPKPESQVGAPQTGSLWAASSLLIGLRPSGRAGAKKLAPVFLQLIGAEELPRYYEARTP